MFARCAPGEQKAGGFYHGSPWSHVLCSAPRCPQRGHGQSSSPWPKGVTSKEKKQPSPQPCNTLEKLESTKRSELSHFPRWSLWVSQAQSQRMAKGGGDGRHSAARGRQHVLWQSHKQGSQGVGAGYALTEVSTEDAPSVASPAPFSPYKRQRAWL